MSRLTFLILLAGSVLLVFLPACEQKSASSGAQEPGAGRVAVVDLDKVAKAMGWTDELQKNTAAVDQELQVQLSTLRENLTSTVENERKKIGDKPTKEQQEQLVAMVNAANEKYRGAIQQAQQESARSRANVITQYRDEVRPVARRVAQERGLSVILIPTEGILYYDPQVDVTDKVIDDLQKIAPVVKSKNSATTQPASQPTP